MIVGNNNGAIGEDLSPKEIAKARRRKAYEEAKERRKSDPRYLALKEKLRQQRRVAYQKAKDRAKAVRVANKKQAILRAQQERAERDRVLMATLVAASSFEPSIDNRHNDGGEKRVPT